MSIDERIRKILNDNNMDQTEASIVTGISGSSLSRLLNKKNEKSHELEAIFKICKTDNQRFYLATGKLPSITLENTISEELTTIIKSLKESICLLTKEVGELRVEIKNMREENKSAQVRLPSKIPEHH